MSGNRMRQDSNEEHFNADGFWIGSAGEASGILAVCRTSKRICMAWRNVECEPGDCWGSFGGAIKAGMAPVKGALTELENEAGYTGTVDTYPAYVFSSGTFKYHNFIGMVDFEFGLNPTDDEAWETDFIDWRTLAEIQSDMEINPDDYHYGMIALFRESGDLLRRLVGATE